MVKPFHELRERLLRGGVAPRHAGRYLGELADHLANLVAEEECAGCNRRDAEYSALIRLGSADDLASAMIEKHQFQSWSSRAPWAVFGLAPISTLAPAYFASCLYLWIGWKIFLPGANTPFGNRATAIVGFENIYFQAGKFWYFGAPVFIGWIVGVVAVRQRLKAPWPTAAWVLVASMGATARVYASRFAVPHALGHIRMELFALDLSGEAIPGQLFHALAILALTALPYFAWRFQRIRQGRA